jgi:hypothetical protein
MDRAHAQTFKAAKTYRSSYLATLAVARLASERNERAAIADHTPDTRDGAQLDSATQAEIDVVARVLCAISRHATLQDSLLSFYASLDAVEARERSARVLDRMRKILPQDLAENLQRTGSYTRPWAERDEDAAGRGSRFSRLALPAIFLVGAMIITLSVVGSITAIHYLFRR